MRWLRLNPFAQRYRSILFEITQRCNLDCLYCYNVWKNGDAYPRGELSTEKTKELLQKAIIESRCRNVTLTGGEPFLRQDILDIISYVSGMKVSITIITNGTLLDADTIKQCIKYGAALFEVPLLSTRKDVQDGLMRGESFDKVLDAIATIRSAGGKVVPAFVATKKNIADLRGVLELSIGMAVDGFMLNRFNPGGEGKKHIDELLPTKDEFENALKIADEISVKYSFPVVVPIPTQPCLIDVKQFKKLKFSFCAAGRRNAYFAIDPLGNLRMCNHTPHMLGSLFNEHFHVLATKQDVRAFAKSIPLSCAGCRISHKCRGGCPAAAEVCYGSVENEDPFLSRNIHCKRGI
jgi:radical SAM protein with 4Fe4S-binding SPASM domain